MFGTYISPLNGSGIFVVLVSSAWYSYISVVEESKQKQKHALKTVGSQDDNDNNNDDDDNDEEAGSTEVVPLIEKESNTIVHRT